MNLFALLSTIAIVLLLNSFFHILPWLLPRLDPMSILPYQLWGNALLIFYFILPGKAIDNTYLKGVQEEVTQVAAVKSTKNPRKKK